MRNKTCGVYVIVNTISDYVYVGSSVNMEKRLRDHLRELKYLRHSNWKMHRDVVRFGFNSFVAFHIEECSESVVIDREQYWIDTMNSVALGYNINPKAQGFNTPVRVGWRHTLEAKLKVSQANKGLKRTPAELERLKIARAASYAKDPTIRERLSLAQKARWAKVPKEDRGKHRIGKKLSEETIAKRSAAKLNKKEDI